jgi:predicted enzyme related to lactoylglutathione lyase
MIRFEHYALNLADPHAVADWYVTNFDCRILSKLEQEPFTVFLGDSQGRVFWEIYHNTGAPLSQVRGGHPGTYHLAFSVDALDAVRDRAIAAGAAFVEEVTTPSGSRLVMLRDPWGIPVQLCRRVAPFLSDVTPDS